MSIRSIRAQEIEEKIKNRAIDIGNKAAYSEELRALCIKLKLTNVQVPDFLPLTTQQVFKYLDQYASGWQKIWRNFVQNQEKSAKEIASNAIPFLIELRKVIEETMAKHPIESKYLEEFLAVLKGKDPLSVLMVRSTGMEDAVDLANAGGNESVVAVQPNLGSISEAMGTVVASYFSEKSLKQRLLGKKDITRNPFIPVLIQKMVGKASAEDVLKKPQSVMRSGVMYTGIDGIRLEVAPGLGELVVNSKGFADKYFVTRENVVHTEINYKTHCSVPINPNEITQNGERTKLIANPPILRDNPAISQEVAKKIAEVGRLIDEHFGRSMDIEFVYDPNPDDPNNGILYLVQARPREMLSLKPTAIPPTKLEQVKKEAVAFEEASVITDAGSVLQVITKPEEILICRDINTAHLHYIAQENSPIKAVIVQEMVGNEFSHEAATFDRQEIPVMQMDDIRTIEKWMSGKKPVVLVDVQNKLIVQMTGKVQDHENAEAELREKGIIQEGLFKSPMNPRETVITTFENLVERKLHIEKFDVNSKIDGAQKLGDLIIEANSSDIKISELAFNKLLQQLYSLIPNAEWKKNPKEKFYTDMMKCLQTIEHAKIGDSNQEAFIALNSLLVGFARLSKSVEGQKYNSSHKKLFRQSLITGAEIYKSLVRLSMNPEESKEDSEQLQIEHLDLVSRIRALVSNRGNKNLISDSIMQIAQKRKAAKEALEVPGSEKLSSDQLEIFVELLKLRNLAMNKKIKKQWTEFALTCCQDPTLAKRISGIVHFAMMHGIASDWLNENFTRQMKEMIDMSKTAEEEVAVLFSKQLTANTKQLGSSSKVRKVLRALEREMVATAKTLPALQLNEKQALIQAWERRLPEWGQPAKFNTLWAEYQKKILPLINDLDVKNISQPLVRKMILNTVLDLTELMDKTIKAITGSSQYKKTASKEQLERFVILLEPFLTLMEKWVLSVPEATFENWRKFGGTIDKKMILEKMRATFEQLQKNLGPQQLKPAVNVSVEAAGIDSSILFMIAFTQKQADVTLETLFSLMHHNIKAALSVGRQNILAENLPEPIEPLFQTITSLPFMKLAKTEYIKPVLTLDYNIPQSVHSLKCSIQYDQKTEKCQIKLYLFGNGKSGRWNRLHMLAALDAFAMGVEFKPDPGLAINPECDDVVFSFEMDSKKLSENINILKAILTSYKDISYQFSDSMVAHAQSFFGRINITSVEQAKDFLTRLIEFGEQNKPSFLDNVGFLLEFIKYLDKYDDKEITSVLTKLTMDQPSLLHESTMCQGRSPDYQFAELLVSKYNANINGKIVGKALLQHAIDHYDMKPFDFMIKFGADAKYQDKITGNTYLHQIILDDIKNSAQYGGKFGRERGLKKMTTLMQHGADPSLKNTDGFTALEIVESAIKDRLDRQYPDVGASREYEAWRDVLQTFMQKPKGPNP